MHKKIPDEQSIRDFLFTCAAPSIHYQMQGFLPVGFAATRRGELIFVQINCMLVFKYVQM